MSKNNSSPLQSTQPMSQGERALVLAGRISRALEVAPMGQYDGAHHKDWVIDQMVRALTGDSYDEWVKGTMGGDWEVGTPP